MNTSKLTGLTDSLFSFETVDVVRPTKTLLHPFSFFISGKHMVTIVGPSGAGKSTFLRLFNRMTIPSSGNIRYKNRDFGEYPLLKLRRQIPMVLQEPVMVEGTVETNLLMPFRIKRWKSDTPTKEKMENVLSICEIGKRFISENSQVLSAGEKQRVSIARALLLDPAVLLMDEPTSALDVETARRLLDNLRESYPTMSLIIVTHDLGIIKKSEGSIVIKNGHVQSHLKRLADDDILRILKEDK